MSHNHSWLVKSPISYFQSEHLSKHRKALKNSNRRRDAILINNAELDWSLHLGNSPPSPPVHRLHLISFCLKAHRFCKENEEAEAINHSESLLKADVIAAPGRETRRSSALAGAGRVSDERQEDAVTQQADLGQNPMSQPICSL